MAEVLIFHFGGSLYPLRVVISSAAGNQWLNYFPWDLQDEPPWWAKPLTYRRQWKENQSLSSLQCPSPDLRISGFCGAT